jgi:hypothetical protein
MPQKGWESVPDNSAPAPAPAGWEPVPETEQPGAAASSPPLASSNILTRLWNLVNTGLISPDTLLKPLAAVQNRLPAQQVKLPSTVAGLGKIANTPRAGESPTAAALRAFSAGAGADVARTVSSFTSPMSISTAALGEMAAVPGALGKIARALLMATGLTYGGQGVMQTWEGISKGLGTPEGAQEALLGASQVAGAGPALKETGRIAQGAAAHLVPQAFAEGERAFLSAIEPARKNVTALRRAYRDVAPELANAPVHDLPELQKYAGAKAYETAVETNNALMRVGMKTVIDPTRIGGALRSRISRLMEVDSPKDAQFLRDYATRVESELSTHPINLPEAEAWVQELNAKTAQFDRMTPAEQRQELNTDPKVLGQKLLKEALQQQIEQSLTNYKGLKRRYGSWKEISNQAQAQIDKIESSGMKISWTQKRAIESLMSAGGMVFGAHELGGAYGGVGGLFSGYLLARFLADAAIDRISQPERMLQRGLRPTTPVRFRSSVLQPVAAGTEQQQ